MSSPDQTPLMGTAKNPPSYNTHKKMDARWQKMTQAATRRSTSLGESLRNIVNQSLSFQGSRCSVRDMGGHATVGEQVFNLVKNLVGAGVLALPSGVSAFANAPSAIIPASVHLVIMGAIFAYFFLLLGKICKLTHAATYREAWEESMGEKGGTLVATVNMLKPALGNLAYSMILADTFKSLSETAGIYLSRNKTWKKVETTRS